MHNVTRYCIPLFMASAVLVAACAPDVRYSKSPISKAEISNVPLWATEALPGAICNHAFSDAQKSTDAKYTETEENTIITGASGGELLNSLQSVVPNSGVGNTKWNLKWSFDYRNRLSGCSITNVKTNVAVQYHLPLWPDQLFATDRDLTDQWNRYSDALRAHHCKHGKTGIDASIELKDALQRMTPRQNCKQLEDDANTLARSVVSKFKQLESRFVAPAAAEFITR